MTKFKPVTIEQPRQSSKNSRLSDAIHTLSKREKASFHTPGHKAKLPWLTATLDVTELPGLDDLSNPQGLLADLESSLSAIWEAKQSFISVNGASAALEAAIIACTGIPGRYKILVPQNAHRSTINALIISGLEPVWYKPAWDQQFNLWAQVYLPELERLLLEHSNELAAVLVVSPTYAGAISDIKSISEVTAKCNIPLIVDEAHGAHFGLCRGMPESSLVLGADLVVHSLHKTLPALTQTGIVHIAKSPNSNIQGWNNSDVFARKLREALGLLQSSSPSYLLLSSIDHLLQQLDDGSRYLSEALSHWLDLRHKIEKMPHLEAYKPRRALFNPSHILVKPKFEGKSPFNHVSNLYDYMLSLGIYPETILGDGVLYMLGSNTRDADCRLLVEELENYGRLAKQNPSFDAELNSQAESGENLQTPSQPEPDIFKQAISPRQAFLMPSESVPTKQAKGRISAQCLAPCPPGTCVLVPGQYIEKTAHISAESVRVVIE